MAQKEVDNTLEKDTKDLSKLENDSLSNMVVFDVEGTVIFHSISPLVNLEFGAESTSLSELLGEDVAKRLLQSAVLLKDSSSSIVLKDVIIKESGYVLSLSRLSSQKGMEGYSVQLFTEKQYMLLQTNDQSSAESLNCNSGTFIEEFAIPYVLLELICNEKQEPIDYKYIAMNGAFEELSEMRADQFIDKTCLEVFGSVDMNWLSFIYDVSLKKEATKLFDYDKNFDKYLEISVLSPRELVVACAYFDITDFITSNKSLKAEQDYVKSLLGVNPDMMFVLSNEGVFENWHCSDVNIKDLYMDPDKFLNKNVRTIFPANLGELTMAKISDVLTNKHLVEYNYSLELDGRVQHFDARMVPYGADKVVSFIRNISKSVSVEEELEDHRKIIVKKNKFLREVMDGIANPLWVVEKNQKNQFIYTDSNDAHTALTGVDLDGSVDVGIDLLGDKFGAEYLKSVTFRYEECIQSKEQVQYEEYLRINGEEVWNLTTLSPQFDDHGDVYRMVCSATDITHLKKAQEETILAKEKAMEADRLKTVFLANLSHEIRTPLNSIIGFSELIQEGDLEDREREDMCRIIERNSSQLMKLISDIIEISKIESEQLKVMYRDFDINRLMDDLAQEVEVEMYRKKKVLPVKVEKELYDRVIFSSDEYRIKQIFQHLLNNAQKFCEKGYIEFGYTREEGNKGVLFFVRDTGIGIERQKQDAIFDLFRQIDDNSTRRYSGTGLGLALCQRITNILGGKMWVESELGKGATFFFSIPKRT